MFFKRRKNADVGDPKVRSSTKVTSTGAKGESERRNVRSKSGTLNGEHHLSEEKEGVRVHIRRHSMDHGPSEGVSSRTSTKRQDRGTGGAAKGPSSESVASRQTFGMSGAIHKSLEFQMNPQSVVSGGHESSYNVSANRTVYSTSESQQGDLGKQVREWMKIRRFVPPRVPNPPTHALPPPSPPL